MGRRARELSERLRASLWAFAVKRLSGKTWEELDVELAPGRTLSRNDSGVFTLMRRIAFNGDAPEHVRCGARGYLDLVANSAAQYPTAYQDYRSPIWALLRRSSPATIDQLVALCDEALSKLQMIRPSIATCLLAEEVLGLKNPENPFAVGDLSLIQRGADQLAELGNLDALLVCAVQTRLAISFWAFDEASVYSDAMRRCAQKYEETTTRGLAKGMLPSLLGRRVVQDDWLPLHPGYWPRSRSILKGTTKAMLEEDAGFLFPGDYELGPFALASIIPQPSPPILDLQEHDSADEWIRTLFRKSFKIDLSPPTAVPERPRTDEEKQRIKYYQHLLKKQIASLLASKSDSARKRDK